MAATIESRDNWDRHVAAKIGKRPVHRPGIWSQEADDWFRRYTALLLTPTPIR